MSGQLCLKWNNHSVAFNKLLEKIYLEDVYSDGTILCQGKFYPVHRFVLSTCSEYFEEMFNHCLRLNNKHPFIIVKDIKPVQMEALLNYMYKGEVNVPQDMLPELIKAAEAFKIKGLAVSDDEEEPSRRKRRSSNSSPSPSQKKSRKQEERPASCDDNANNSLESSNTLCDIKENVEVLITEPPICEIKPEPVESDDKNQIDSSTFKNEEDFESHSNDGSNYEAFDFDPADGNVDSLEGTSASWDDSQVYEEDTGNASDPSQNMSTSASNSGAKKRSQVHQCPFCNFSNRKPYALKRHMQTHTGEKPFSCSKCHYKAGRNAMVNAHYRSVHLKERRFSCEFCDYKATKKTHLQKHISRWHATDLPPN